LRRPEDKFTSGLFGAAADVKEGYLSYLLAPSDVLEARKEEGARLLSEYAKRKA
jgi:hypothetical protein